MTGEQVEQPVTGTSSEQATDTTNHGVEADKGTQDSQGADSGGGEVEDRNGADEPTTPSRDEGGQERDEVAHWKSMSRKNEDGKKHFERRYGEEVSAREAAERARDEAIAERDRVIVAAAVSAETGVPIQYLSGADRDAMVTAAEEFKRHARQVSGVGYVGSQGTGERAPAVNGLQQGQSWYEKHYKN